MKTEKKNLLLRDLEENDCSVIPEAFKAQGWQSKSNALYREYFQQQSKSLRDMIIAEKESHFVGYLTIRWQSNYPFFRERNIPEIVDFNVLKKYQRQQIGTTLMDEAEKRIVKVSLIAGIGVGLTADYGAAHILYIKRGYIPDGQGVTSSLTPLSYGEQVPVDDDLVLYLIKNL